MKFPDYFAFLGLPRKLNIDVTELEKNFRALSRQFHPDFFHNASAAERRASLEQSSYLNDAYRTLRQPIARIEYLVDLEAGSDETARNPSGGATVPPALLEEVFALNEELDSVRELRSKGAPDDEWKARLEAARQPIEARRDNHERQLHRLSAEWDSLIDRATPDGERRAVLQALRERLLERNYINNLLAGIERELSG